MIAGTPPSGGVLFMACFGFKRRQGQNPGCKHHLYRFVYESCHSYMSHVAHFTTPTSLNFFDRMWMSAIDALCIALAHPCMHSNLHESSIEEHAMAPCPQQCTALCASRCQATTASLQARSRDHAGSWQKARQPGPRHRPCGHVPDVGTSDDSAPGVQCV